MATTRLNSTQVILLIIIALLSCGVATSGAFLIVLIALRPFAVAQVSPTPAPEIKPTIVTEAAPGDMVWRRIQERGKLIVGTTVDYPPFEYYTPNFQIDGFDIAIIRAIGEKLGLAVEIRDMAFEGLASALTLGEIDVAIAAISISPERQAEFGFSNVYFVSQDAILANSAAAIESITSVDQMAAYHVGVQSGSVYEKWLKESLVHSGQMTDTNLSSYALIDQAVTDLRQGRLDVLVLDYLPAMDFVSQGNVKLVGKELNLQRYAIGTAPAAVELQSRINQALLELQNEGKLADFIQQYLNLSEEEIIAAPTSAPTQPPPQPTPTPQGYCVDGMAFASDLTYPNNNMRNPPAILPGTPFQKGWRIRNTGTCTWDSSYTLNYASGNSPYASLGGGQTYLSGSVTPGSETDVYVNLVAPLFPGVYQGFWVMQNTQGIPFGDRLQVGINVPVLNPATPTPVIGSPFIQRFTVFPEQITAGGCVQIQWAISGNLTRVRISNNLRVLWDGAPAQGVLQDCLQYPGQVIYQINAEGPGGASTANDFVNVFNDPLPQPTPGNAPIVTAFSATPPQISLNQCFTLSWSVDGNANRIQLYRNNLLILDNAPFSGVAQDCPSVAGQITYRIVASNLFRQTASESRVVQVSGALNFPAVPVAAQPQPQAE